MADTDSLIGYAFADLFDPSSGGGAYDDSLIGFVAGTIENPTTASGSTIGYATRILNDPASPFVTDAGALVEIRGFTKKAGVLTQIKRWRIMDGGVAVPLRRPVISTDGFIDHVTVPDETNTGVLPGVARTAYTGPAMITTPTIIKDKNITYRLDNRSNLQLINCYVSTVGNSSQQSMIENTNASAVLYAERCTFIPATLNFYTNSANGHDVHFYRCLVKHTVDGFSPYGNSIFTASMGELDCCRIGPLAWFENDAPVHLDGTHNDITQLHGGGFFQMHGCSVYGYKYNALGTPALDSSADNLYPQVGQIFLAQHTVGYIPGYLASERALSIDGSGFPIAGSWGGAPLIHHNWFWGGGAAGIFVKSQVYFGNLPSGSPPGQKNEHVDCAVWCFNNTWMDVGRVNSGTTYPYPCRTNPNVYWNGSKYPVTSAKGWTDTTSPEFDWGNKYDTSTSIPVLFRGTAVGLRVDSAPASVPRLGG